jgi:glycerol uptake facilitator-like aquaporin
MVAAVLPRRLLAEFAGTALLVTVVVGSGIAAAVDTVVIAGRGSGMLLVGVGCDRGALGCACKPGNRQHLRELCSSANIRPLCISAVLAFVGVTGIWATPREKR